MGGFSFDVAIVGFGPAGEALASLLGRAGHKVVVFEKFPRPYGMPRMSTLDGEVARLLQHTSDWKLALRSAIPQLEVESYGAEGQRLGALDWRHRHSGHPSHLSVHQPDIESAMAERIATYRSVRVLWGHEVVDFHARSGGGFGIQVIRRTEAEAHADELTLTFSARYLVGMDGASSMVRRKLGIELDVIHQHDDRWILTDFDVVQPLPNGLDHRIYFDMAVEEPYFYGPNGAGRCRTDVRVEPEDSDDVVHDHERAYDLLERRVGIPRNSVRITRRLMYRFRSQIAQTMRVGDAFIGGDAAHAMPPFLGQGACTAMRDAVNLAWKLDMVLSGAADVALLDTYEAERLEHSGQFVHGSLGVWSIVNVPDVESARARDAFMAENAMVSFEPDPIDDGIVHRMASGQLGAQAGTLAPQGLVRSNGEDVLLDDVVGFGFQLITKQAAGGLLGPERIARLKALGVIRLVTDEDEAGATRIIDADGSYEDFFSENAATALLCRPDFYVFGIANGDAETIALVDDLLGKIPPPGQAGRNAAGNWHVNSNWSEK